MTNRAIQRSRAAHPATVNRIETLLQKLEQAGHATLAAPMCQQLQAKLPRKKKGWKFW